MDEQLGRIVELRFFGGLSVEETAGVRGVELGRQLRKRGSADLGCVRARGATGP